MKNFFLLFLLFGFILLSPTYSGAKIIKDADPINIGYGVPHHVQRYQGNMYSHWNADGSQPGMGAYFYLEGEVLTGGFLESWDDIIQFTAVHTGTNNKYILQEQRGNFSGTPVSFWFALAKPQTWMFEDNWKFILKYNGTDGLKHRQILTVPPGAPAFPPIPSHLALIKSANDFILSWSGIGDPNTQESIDYQVKIFETGTINWIETIRGNWSGGGTRVTGTYDAWLNKVTFTIPKIYGGEGYYLKVENRVLTSRGVYYLVLPSFNP